MNDNRLRDFIDGYQSLSDHGKLTLEIAMIYILLKGKPDLSSMRMASAILFCCVLPRLILPVLLLLAGILLMITFCNMAF